MTKEEQWAFFDSLNEVDRSILPLPKDYCEARNIPHNRSMSLQDIFRGMSDQQIRQQTEQAIAFIRHQNKGGEPIAEGGGAEESKTA